MTKPLFSSSARPCRTCEGDCYVVHPTWKKYNAQMGVYSVPDFFLNQGYLPGEPLPPARILCPTCHGLGELPTTAPAKPGSSVRHGLGRLLYKLLGGAPL